MGCINQLKTFEVIELVVSGDLNVKQLTLKQSITMEYLKHCLMSEVVVNIATGGILASQVLSQRRLKVASKYSLVLRRSISINGWRQGLTINKLPRLFRLIFLHNFYQATVVMAVWR